VPVAPALAFCEDPSVNGAPFYVMRFVEGHILRDATSAAAALTPAQRRTAGESLVDVMAEIHAVDPDAVGLGDLGRKEGYIERQLKRWYRQFEQSKLREVPDVDEVHELLLRNVPEQGPATIVHGDYRLDNCMVDDDGHVAAVLDWEICTLGDPMADLGLLCVYWTDPRTRAPRSACRPPPSRASRGGRARGPLRRAQRPGRELGRVLHRLRVLEARLHRRRRLHPLRRRLDGVEQRLRALRRPGAAAGGHRQGDAAGGHVSDPLHELVERPEVDQPVLVVGLDGWIDAGFAANTAVGHLREVMETTLVATWDADVLVDHRSRRPVMHLVEGVNTG
jgi:hypothetical protein